MWKGRSGNNGARRWRCWGCVLLLVSAGGARAQMGGVATAGSLSGIDPGLQRVIAALPAVDDHAHPVLPPPADATDRGFDALPVDNMEAATDPVAWRPDNPQLPAAWTALWGFAGQAPLDAEGLKRLAAARAQVKAREGAHYADWVLDQAGIRTMVANRVAMQAEGGAAGALKAPRFRWVPYVDALVFPLDNAGLAAATPDRGQFFPLEDRLRARYLETVGLSRVPATLDAYLRMVVTPTLERQKREGALAVKFEVAYLRGFAFGDPPQTDAGRVYAQWAGKGVPDAESYKVLQDFLFRYIAREAGRLGLPVHIHVLAGGGGYFDVAGANPLLLEPLFDDPRLRGTRFVMLHGGWPFVHEAGALLQKPNVYLDLSQGTLSFAPRTLAGWLREWLELYPGKVMFGTDGYPYSESMGWEESTWLASRNGRVALELALSGMLADGEVSRARAEGIARAVMAGTAGEVYGLR